MQQLPPMQDAATCATSSRTQPAFPLLLSSLPTFNGTEHEDIARWLARIEQISTSLLCYDEMKLAAALTRLNGAAEDFCDGMSFPSWSHFKHAMISRFSEDMLTTKRRLDKCKQLPHEDTKDYIDRFRILTLRCKMGATFPDDIMNKFIRGLHPMIQDQVTVTCPKTYEEAVTKALYFTKHLSLRTNTRHPGNAAAVEDENDESHYPMINYLAPAHPCPIGTISGQTTNPNLQKILLLRHAARMRAENHSGAACKLRRTQSAPIIWAPPVHRDSDVRG